MKRFIFLVMVTIMCILAGCQKIATEKAEVNGTVVDMQYRRSYTTQMLLSTGKSTTLIYVNHPEQYLVTISYENVSETFDDKSLYKKCQRRR